MNYKERWLYIDFDISFDLYFQDSVSSTDVTNGSDGPKRSKLLKRKVAILLSYAGANYVGMQR